ncbi:fructose-2,6-bisphosphatase TIGAR-like [Tubulanus polymorphus]|uniref:fructose-2,6-bisphosphatase TIGAR-like n=1 Tax=Tubulanus polymorphus TaxID=672921 RepID=UPI003DA60AB3
MIVFTLTLVRHGETPANRDGIIQGQSDVHLSDVGIAQAQLAGNRLKDEKFSHIYSSDLQRALKTAEVIRETNKIARNLPIQQDIRIRERNYGVYEGKTRIALEKAMKTEKLGLDQWNPPEGESIEQLKQRAMQFFHDLCKEMVKLKLKTDPNVEPVLCVKQTRIVNSLNYSSSPESVFTDAADLKNQNADSTSTLNCNGAIEPLQTDINPEDISVPVNIPPKSLCDTDLKNLNAAVVEGAAFPNVSLSPLVEQRVTRMSRISSGRNSFDDSEYIPPLVGEALVVTHGGFIRQLIKYLQSGLDCKLADGSRIKGRWRIPNTAVSKFLISTSDAELDKTRATCLILNDAEHLRGHESTEREEITADRM